MNKRVLVLSSSPRMSGTSDLLCDQFVEGAQKGSNQASLRVGNKGLIRDYSMFIRFYE